MNQLSQQSSFPSSLSTIETEEEIELLSRVAFRANFKSTRDNTRNSKIPSTLSRKSFSRHSPYGDLNVEAIRLSTIAESSPLTP